MARAACEEPGMMRRGSGTVESGNNSSGDDGRDQLELELELAWGS